MTILVALSLVIGGILIVSAISDKSIRDTIQAVLKGDQSAIESGLALGSAGGGGGGGGGYTWGPNESTSTNRVVALALSEVGGRYVAGGTTTSGWDCSGFVRWVYDKFGFSLPRTAAQQYSYTQRIARSDLQPGDLVFFKNTDSRSGITHVGIYIGNNRMVSAQSEQAGVAIASLSSSFWSSHYAGAGRVGAR